MNQMQQMLANAQRMQRELAKAHAQLEAKDFEVSKNGIVTVVVKGNHQISKIEIDPEALADDKEMVEEALVLALNEANEAINKESEAIDERITGQTGGFPF